MSGKIQTKTLAQLFKEYGDWKQTFRQGALGNQEAYAKARDTRKYFEETKWVDVDVLKQKVPLLLFNFILRYAKNGIENLVDENVTSKEDALKEIEEWLLACLEDTQK
jgi:hypothetical protein